MPILLTIYVLGLLPASVAMCGWFYYDEVPSKAALVIILTVFWPVVLLGFVAMLFLLLRRASD